MKRILDILIAFKEYAALAVYMAVALVLIGISQSTDVQPLRAFTTGVVGVLQSSTSWITNPFALSRENAELRQRGIELASEVGRLRRAKVENDELRRMLGVGARPEWKLLPCEVVGKTTTFERNMLTLSRGQADGILNGMAVVTDAGLVGIVYSVSTHFSLVEMLFNRDFRAAAKVGRTRVEGIVAWDGGPTLVMRNVPKALDVMVGDLIVTSEYSTFFPAEVPIGTVLRIEAEPNSLFRRVTLEPTVNLFRVEHAYVVLKDASLEQERLTLEQKAKDDAAKQPLKK
jgi:rod shape-determining protein MreC